MKAAVCVGLVGVVAAHKQPMLFDHLLDDEGNEIPPHESERRLSVADGKHHPKAEHTLGGGSSDHDDHGKKMWDHRNHPEREIDQLEIMPTWDEFYENYVRKNKPVIMKNMFINEPGHTTLPAFDMPAVYKWDDQYLRKEFGDMQIDVEFHKTEVRGGPTERTSFKKFIRSFMRPKFRNSEKLYAVIPFETHPGMLEDLALPPVLNCSEIYLQSATLWMSSGHTSSVLHQDDAENFLMMLDGTKEILLANQDHAHDLYATEALHPGTSAVHQSFTDMKQFPRFESIDWEHGAMSRGDILYIPNGYWHQVTSHNRNLAINIWWGHEEEHAWWDASMDTRVLGHPKSPHSKTFDQMKKDHSAPHKCTPRRTDTLSGDEFVDDGDWKDFITRNRERVQAGQSPVSAASFFKNAMSRDIEL